MTKFKYPVDGLYKPSILYFESARSKISSAINHCGNSVPATFSHRSYLNNLKITLSNMKQELDVIERLFKRNDNVYKSMSVDIESSMAKMEFYNIEERERMIK